MRRSSVALSAATLFAVGLFAAASCATAAVVDFEDMPLAANSYYNGSDGAGQFVSGGAIFTNSYDNDYRTWMGWAASNKTDSTTAGYMNQYSAFPGSGGNGSAKYGIAFLGTNSYSPGALAEFHNGLMHLPAGMEPTSVQIANTTYAAKSMLNGDAFAKKFGGNSGNDPDWFRLAILGNNSDGIPVAARYVYLADFRSPSQTGDSVESGWINVDLSHFRGKGVTNLTFGLDSTDSGQFGMNTPGYIALDNLVLSSTSPQRITGDTNSDGRVDGLDLASLVSNLGLTSGATWETGDFNSDGRVSVADLMLLRSNLNLGTGGGGTPAAVPEPQSIVLILAAAGTLCVARRRRK
jgi:hypothetical protein